MSNFFTQLKQRRVYRVAIGYAIVAWLVVQVAATVLPAFHSPEFVLPLVIVLLAIGFPVALMLAWAFDVTPTGLEKTPEGMWPGVVRNLRYAWALGAVGLLVATAGVGAWWLRHSPGTTQPVQSTAESKASKPDVAVAPSATSIGVLPFVNMSGNAENEYFSDGITEEILNALARTPGLRVPARTSAFFFKGKNEPVQKIGEALKVAVVLEGSVRRAGDQLRITAQLINVADGYHLWSDTFDRKAEDVFAIQTEVAQRVLEVLKVKLLGNDEPTVARIGTQNLEAYDLFLRGRQLWNKRTGADIKSAIGYFQEATEKDPNFALAYAALGASYVILPRYSDATRAESLPKARAAVRRALELDPKLAEAHAVLARSLAAEGDHAGAEKAIIEAIALNPNYATAHHWYSSILQSSGKPEQGLAEARKAEALDPLSPVIQANVGTLLFMNRKYPETLTQLDKVLQLSPDFAPAYRVRSWVRMKEKKFDEAITDLEKVRSLASDDPDLLTLFGYCYAATGRTNEALERIEQLKAEAAKGRTAAADIALIYQGLGDKDQAWAWLEKGASDPKEGIIAYAFNPLWDESTSDPRFAALIKKNGVAR